MKTKLHIKLMLAGWILSFLIPINAEAQIYWEKHENNPVLTGFASWASNVYSPVVMNEEDTFKMWFGAGSTTTFNQIGYAESLDGIEWTPNDDPVIYAGVGLDWNRDKTPGSILLVNDTLKLWYSGSSDNFGLSGSIGYAWSVENNVWNLEPDPVLIHGDPGAWDGTAVFKPVVYWDGNIYHMWYHGYYGSSIYAPGEIGYATSADGINWVKDMVNNPVLELGENGTFYDTWIIPNAVLFIEGEYQLWFTGWDGFGTNPTRYMRIGYATSPDGIEWTVQNGEMPVLDVGEEDQWDENVVRYSSVLFHEGRYKMWYDGAGFTSKKIGYATSRPTIHVPGDETTIQAGIDAAEDGDIVMVEEGTYYENINFNGKAITVASHFLMDGDTNHITNTIIDGSQPMNSDSASVVYFVSGEDTTSVILGFTIQGGSGTPSSWGNGISGGGIFTAQSCPKIEYNRIINNHCEGGGQYVSGGGVFCNNGSDGMVIVKNNLISGNSCTSNQTGTYAVTGGGISSVNDAIIIGNTIINNSIYHGSNNRQAVGGGVECSYSKALIKNNVIIDNIAQNSGSVKTPWGGGIYGEDNKEGSVVSGNMITGNSVNGTLASSFGGGIGFWNNSNNITIDKNIIRNNASDNGAGISIGLNHGVEITNNLIWDNDADFEGGGIYLRSSGSDEKMAVRKSGMNTNNISQKSLPGEMIPAIANNTIVENSSGQRGGGISCNFSGIPIPLVIFNNIIYENTAAMEENEIYLISSALAYLYNNNIDTAKIYGSGSWYGTDNISSDPEFINPASGNYCIDSCNSPCAGSGIDSLFIVDQGLFFAPDHDILNRPRPIPLSSLPDMGAYEVDLCVGIYDSQFDHQNSESNFNLQVYPNPCSGIIYLQFKIKNQQLTSLNLYDITSAKIKGLLNEVKTVGDHDLEVDLSNLPAGVYFCTLKTDRKVETIKLIKY